MRIESHQASHREMIQRQGSTKVNGLRFGELEGRVVSEPVSEDKVMSFIGVEGYSVLHDDLSFVKTTKQQERQTARPAMSQTPGGLIVPTATLEESRLSEVEARKVTEQIDDPTHNKPLGTILRDVTREERMDDTGNPLTGAGQGDKTSGGGGADEATGGDTGSAGGDTTSGNQPASDGDDLSDYGDSGDDGRTKESGQDNDDSAANLMSGTVTSGDDTLENSDDPSHATAQSTLDLEDTGNNSESARRGDSSSGNTGENDHTSDDFGDSGGPSTAADTNPDDGDDKDDASDGKNAEEERPMNEEGEVSETEPLEASKDDYEKRPETFADMVDQRAQDEPPARQTQVSPDQSIPNESSNGEGEPPVEQAAPAAPRYDQMGYNDLRVLLKEREVKTGSNPKHDELVKLAFDSHPVNEDDLTA